MSATDRNADPSLANRRQGMRISDFQRRIEQIYFDRDHARGVEGTFVWFVEEVGELAKEVRREPRDAQRLREEISDVLAWLSTLASLLEIDLSEAADRYANGCPKCDTTPCRC